MGRISFSIAVGAALWLVAFDVDGQVASVELGPDGVSIVDADDKVHLGVDLTRPVPWRIRFEDGPPRLVVELTGVRLVGSPRVTSTSIEDVQMRVAGPDRSELVAILREPLAVTTAEMVADDDGARLDVQLEPTTADVFRTEAAEPVVMASVLPVVAIDPGHGGIDPGAEAGELDEADLVLEFARRLQEALMQSGQFDVVLTREDDRFVSLDERLSRARAANAKMFLSIHADALDGADASGMVVYSLDPSAEGRATRRLTERHGDDELLSGVDLAGAGDDVAEALIDLSRRENAPRTEALSRALVGAFRASGLEVNSRPERSGDFAVLKAADVPSVLVELGFLSTEEDLARLTSDAWQREASQAIRDALMLWHDEDRLR